jgi:50S ribosome-binding GTPase
VSDPVPGLAELIATVRAEAIALGRDDLAGRLPGPLGARDTMRRTRVVVAGGPGAGKSSLINGLLGRPGLSPAATGCWIEFRYGAADSATILLADPADPGTPRRLAADLTELPGYGTLDRIAAPVVGAEVRLDEPILRELVLVDTPGAPTGTTLAALRQADALLYVGDATRSIRPDEIDFLIEAGRRVQTVAVAMNKIDTPGHGRAVAETRRRLGDRPELARFAVHAVSAHLADRAGQPGTAHTAAIRLTEAAGVRPLVDRLLYDAAAGAARLRSANQARITATIARELLVHIDQAVGPAERIGADVATVTTLLDGGGLLGARLEQARNAAALRFATAADALPPDGPPLVLAGLAAAAADTLDEVQDHVLDALRDGLRDDVLIPSGADLDLRLRAPDASRPRALDLLPTVTGLLTGSAPVVSVLTGSAAVATGLAVAACAGWWRSGDDPWREAAVAQAKTMFDGELRRRVRLVRQYAAEHLPHLLEARRDRLRRLGPDSAPDAVAARATLTLVLEDLSHYHRPADNRWA